MLTQKEARKEINRRIKNKVRVAEGKAKKPAKSHEALNASAAQLNAWAGLPDSTPKRKSVAKAVAAEATPKRPSPLKGVSRLGLHPNEVAARDAIYARVGGGVKYQTECAKAVWVDDKGVSHTGIRTTAQLKAEAAAKASA